MTFCSALNSVPITLTATGVCCSLVSLRVAVTTISCPGTMVLSWGASGAVATGAGASARASVGTAKPASAVPAIRARLLREIRAGRPETVRIMIPPGMDDLCGKHPERPNRRTTTGAVQPSGEAAGGI